MARPQAQTTSEHLQAGHGCKAIGPWNTNARNHFSFGQAGSIAQAWKQPSKNGWVGGPVVTARRALGKWRTEDVYPDRNREKVRNPRPRMLQRVLGDFYHTHMTQPPDFPPKRSIMSMEKCSNVMTQHKERHYKKAPAS